MNVTVNNKVIKFPTTLSEITLGQRIAFDALYGKDINEGIASVQDMPDDEMKPLEWGVLHMDIACKQFSFFSNIPLEIVQETPLLEEVMNVYNVMSKLLADDAAQPYKESFAWNGDVWELHPPELKSTSSLTFGELIDSKQIIQDLANIGAGRFEQLQRLCAIYLRKKGEKYDKHFGSDDGPRLKLMADLPMDIALSVAFFLSRSISLSLKHLLSLVPLQSKEALTVENTSPHGDG